MDLRRDDQERGRGFPMMPDTMEEHVSAGKSRIPGPARNPRVNVLGVGISPINLESAKQIFLEAIQKRTKGYVCVTCVHGVMEAQYDPSLRDVFNRALLCTPDGMPMVWMGRLQGFKEIDRVYGPDLMFEIFDFGQRHNFRHFFYGGGKGVALELKENLLQRFPQAQITGTFEPPFRPLNEQEILELQEAIRKAQPDIVWVGLSTPKQDRFMAEFLPRLDTTIMVGVGAAFDFHTGRVRQAPRFIQRSGFEWLFRLCHEPRRLWRRYLTHNPVFLWKAFLQLTGLKRYRLE